MHVFSEPSILLDDHRFDPVRPSHMLEVHPLPAPLPRVLQWILQLAKQWGLWLFTGFNLFSKQFSFHRLWRTRLPLQLERGCQRIEACKWEKCLHPTWFIVPADRLWSPPAFSWSREKGLRPQQLSRGSLSLNSAAVSNFTLNFLLFQCSFDNRGALFCKVGCY